MKPLRIACCAILVLALSFGMAPSQAVAQEDAQLASKKDKTGTNPINFTFDARLYNEYRWLNTAGDGDQNITTFEFRMPLAGGKWQFRSKIRYESIDIDMAGVDEAGMGDTDIRFLTIPYLKKFAVATGVEFFLDTASEDALGKGATIVGPMIFLGFFNPIGKGSILVPGYQHKISIDEDSGRSKVNEGLIDMFLVKTFKSNQYWGFIDPQILLDYENNKEFMLLELQAGMMIGDKGHSAYIMPSFGVGDDRPYDTSVEVAYKIIW